MTGCLIGDTIQEYRAADLSGAAGFYPAAGGVPAGSPDN